MSDAKVPVTDLEYHLTSMGEVEAFLARHNISAGEVIEHAIAMRWEHLKAARTCAPAGYVPLLCITFILDHQHGHWTVSANSWDGQYALPPPLKEDKKLPAGWPITVNATFVVRTPTVLERTHSCVHYVSIAHDNDNN